jgi:hypothetical protein
MITAYTRTNITGIDTDVHSIGSVLADPSARVIAVSITHIVAMVLSKEPV